MICGILSLGDIKWKIGPRIPPVSVSVAHHENLFIFKEIKNRLFWLSTYM